MPRLRLVLIIAIPLTLPAPAPATAQAGLTLEQVQRKYRQMNEVHILKCDRDGNLIFTQSEMLCVSSIYQVMYLDRS